MASDMHINTSEYWETQFTELHPTLTEWHEFYATTAKLLRFGWKVALPAALAGRMFSKITNVQLLVAVVASLVVRNRAQHLQQKADSEYFLKDPRWFRKQGLDVAKFAVNHSLKETYEKYQWHYENLLLLLERQLMVIRAQLANPDFNAVRYLNKDGKSTIEFLDDCELKRVWERLSWNSENFGILLVHPAFRQLNRARQQHVLNTYRSHFALKEYPGKDDLANELRSWLICWMRGKIEADRKKLEPQEFVRRHGYGAFRPPWSVSGDKLLEAVKKQNTLKDFLSEFGAAGVGDTIPIQGHLGKLILQHLVPKLRAYLSTNEGKWDHKPLLTLFHTDKSLKPFEPLMDEILEELKIPTFRDCCGKEYDAIQNDFCELENAFPLLKRLTYTEYEAAAQGIRESEESIRHGEEVDRQLGESFRQMGVTGYRPRHDIYDSMRSSANARYLPSEREVELAFLELVPAQPELSEMLRQKLDPVIDAHWKLCEENDFNRDVIPKPEWPFKTLDNGVLSMLLKIPSDAEHLRRMKIGRESVKGVLLMGSWKPSVQFKTVMAKFRKCGPKCEDKAAERKRKRREAYPLIRELRKMLYCDFCVDADKKLADLDAARAEWSKAIENRL